MRRFSLFFLFLWFAALSFAQESSSIESPDYTITVTADRLEQPWEESTDALEVISSEEIEQKQATTILELLRDIPGVHIVQSGSAGKITSAFVRGANPKHLLVLVDGVEINNPFFGGVDLADFLTTGIERIEILKGPQSPLYGSDAMAGVINIITRSGKDQPSGSLFFEAGGMESFRENAGFGGRKGKLDYHGSLSRYDSQGQFENDEYNDLQWNGRFNYRISESSHFFLHTSYNDSHIGIPFNGSRPTPDRNSDTRMAVLGTGYQQRFGSGWNLRVQGSYFRRDFLFQDPADRFSRRTENSSNNYKFTIQNDFLVATRDTLTIGYEEEHQDVVGSTNNVENINETIVSRSLFSQNKLQAGSLILSLGGRLDHHNSFGNHFSSRLSAAWKLGKHFKIRGSGGTAYRAPSAGELKFPFYGNPDLKPEISRSFELGFDFLSPSRSFVITTFHSSYRDLITFDPVTFIAANLDRATTSGLELSSIFRLGSGWNVSAGYTLLHTQNESTGEPLFRRPKHSGSVTVNYARRSWGCNVNLTLIGERYERDFSAFRNRFNPGFVKADLAAFYKIRERLQLQFRIENFLDQEYQEALSFPAPGITGYGGLRINF